MEKESQREFDLDIFNEIALKKVLDLLRDVNIIKL